MKKNVLVKLEETDHIKLKIAALVSGKSVQDYVSDIVSKNVPDLPVGLINLAPEK